MKCKLLRFDWEFPAVRLWVSPLPGTRAVIAWNSREPAEPFPAGAGLGRGSSLWGTRHRHLNGFFPLHTVPILSRASVINPALAQPESLVPPGSGFATPLQAQGIPGVLPKPGVTRCMAAITQKGTRAEPAGWALGRDSST